MEEFLYKTYSAVHTFLVHLTSFGKPFTIPTLPPIINQSYHKTSDNICIVHKYIWYIYSCTVSDVDLMFAQVDAVLGHNMQKNIRTTISSRYMIYLQPEHK
jgi:hypothetical protein